jgi:hypothetical protein
LTCVREASGGYYRAKVVVEEDNLAVNVRTLGTVEVNETVYFEGRATCKQRPPTQLELAVACVLVTHSPFGPFPSFTNWLMQFAKAGLPSNAQAELTATSVNNGQPVSAPIDTATGKVDIKAGISSFRPEAQVQKLTVNGQDVTQQLVVKVGAAPTVTASQGVAAGQCPS